MTDEAYREQMREALSERVGDGKGVAADHPLIQALHYQAGDADKPESFKALRAKIEALEKERQLPGNRLFYLSVAPSFFTVIVQQLAAAGLLHPPQRAGVVARDHREAVRPRPGERPRAHRRASARCSTRARSTASITTSEKRRCRTS